MSYKFEQNVERKHEQKNYIFTYSYHYKMLIIGIREMVT